MEGVMEGMVVEGYMGVGDALEVGSKVLIG